MRFGADRQFGIDGFESKKYYLSEDFEKVRRKTVSYETRAKKGGIVEIPRFTEKVIENEDTGVYASHTGIITDYRDYYPTPYWETEESINAICLSLVLGLDDKNKVINGFSADYIIVKYRKEDPDKDAEYLKKKEEVDAIKGNYTGFSGSKIAILWATPGKDDKGNVVLHKPIEIIEIPSIDPKSMIEIRKNILNTIWAAHGISAPEGFGFSSSEGSGNGLNSQQEYMMQGLVNTFKSRIAPVRDIAVKWYNNFILLNGWSIEAYPIEDLPKRQMSDEHAEKILTINELRERQGLGKLESGGDRLLNQQIDVTE